MTPSLPGKRSRRALLTALHLAASVGLIAAIGAVVFQLWYPSPYAHMAGGLHLFVILVVVDLAVGPLLTCVVATPSKPSRQLRRDIAVIAMLQLASTAYGVYSIAMARPVALSFELVQFRLLSAADIDRSLLASAHAGLRELSWTGPQLIAAVPPSEPTAKLKAIELGLAGFDLSFMPSNWRGYEVQSARAWLTATPIEKLLMRFPSQRANVQCMAARVHRPVTDLRFLPVRTRSEGWTAVVVNPGAQVVGFLPVDTE